LLFSIVVSVVGTVKSRDKKFSIYWAKPGFEHSGQRVQGQADLFHEKEGEDHRKEKNKVKHRPNERTSDYTSTEKGIGSTRKQKMKRWGEKKSGEG